MAFFSMSPIPIVLQEIRGKKRGFGVIVQGDGSGGAGVPGGSIISSMNYCSSDPI